MAYSNPNIPTINIITMDPVSGLVLEGEVTGVPPAGAAYAGIFSLSCQLMRKDAVGTFEMTGIVDNPSWTIMATGGSGISQLTGAVVAGPGSGSQVATIPLTDSHILVGNGSNLATDVVVSGDLVMANTGIATVVGFQNTTIIAGPYTTGDTLYFDGTFWNQLPIGTAGQELTVVAGLPAWVTPGNAPSAYSLGVAAGFAALDGGTFTVSNPTLLVPTGNVTATANVNPGNTTFTAGAFIVGPTAPQTAAVLSLYNQLHALAATNPVDLSTGNISGNNIGYGLGVFVPGVYKSTAAVSVVASTTITLSGVGDYVFDIAAALTTGANVNIVLTNGAQASRVYFVVGTVTGGSSLTIGATNNLLGNFMLGNGAGAIVVGSTATIQGRLLTTATQPITIDGTASSLFLPLS